MLEKVLAPSLSDPCSVCIIYLSSLSPCMAKGSLSVEHPFCCITRRLPLASLQCMAVGRGPWLMPGLLAVPASCAREHRAGGSVAVPTAPRPCSVGSEHDLQDDFGVSS